MCFVKATSERCLSHKNPFGLALSPVVIDSTDNDQKRQIQCRHKRTTVSDPNASSGVTAFPSVNSRFLILLIGIANNSRRNLLSAIANNCYSFPLVAYHQVITAGRLIKLHCCMW